ncbi:MAG: HrgA protein [Flavobacteriales bacterium]|jgi:hypothetical protein|nr:HrgA protein [Flavobacteriales bacterium]
MTFLELAEATIKAVDRPLTGNEIWELAVQRGLDKKLKTRGKTPWATLGARLYVEVRDNTASRFVAVGKRPTRFGLKGSSLELISPTVEATTIDDKNNYSERDLHPMLVYYADSSPHFRGAKLKTIYDQHSIKRKKGVNEWIHPDIVGVYLPFKEYKNELLDLIASISVSAIKLYSFELKKDLDMGNLRRHYFQAVSNSSWAHEGYLVAVKIGDSVVEEVRSLADTFGIGLIQLQPEQVEQSEILIPAKQKAQLDLDAMDKLARDNPEFEAFLQNITNDSKTRKILSTYDQVLSPEAMVKHIEKHGIL